GANYFVTAKSGQDMSFVFSDWNEGIDRWRFNLPGGEDDGPLLAATVFDRSLLRAGETVHMKHFFRRHGSQGLMTLPVKSLPPKLVITHVGSDQKYEMPLTWNADGTAESEWAIPRAAKNGEYQVALEEQAKPDDVSGVQHPAGTFRVEAFRVPTLRASLKPMGAPFINAGKLELDVQLNYLAGGGAGGLAVRLRGISEPYQADFDGYDDFAFANGGVKEGLQSRQDNAESPDSEAAPADAQGSGPHALATQDFVLDASGGARVALDGLPHADAPRLVTAELEYADLNGEVQTSSGRYPLWPSAVVLGIKTDSWMLEQAHVRFKVAALDVAGKPQAGVPIRVTLLKKKSYSHRKRVLGGFYAYENREEISRIAGECKGESDALGLLVCDVASPADGQIILKAEAADRNGNRSLAHKEVWVAGRDESWFEGHDDDRIDVLPESSGYQPGDTASLQVRMPFREATALVTVEREGVLDAFVVPLSGKDPVIKLPVKPTYAPNVYVSVLAVRGRVDGVQPGALIDLGKPAFKLGIGQINVGWRAHQLNVSVQADREKYQVREKAHVRIKVARADGGALPSGAEVALAAVDEGLLELMPNASWDLLGSMMGHRGIEVETATAQMQVIGKRHFGRKAVAHGGGGGHQASRELFETLLKWQGRVTLDAQGEATLDVPLNDVLGSFRIVAIAHAGAGLFGSGATSLQTTQDVMLFSGLPPLVREHDSYRAAFTLRNASERALELQVNARLSASGGGQPVALRDGLPARTVTLAAGEAREISWNVSAPLDADTLNWDVSAQERQGGAADRLKVSQRVVPALPVRTWQATLVRLDKPLDLTVQPPAHAVPGRGGVTLLLGDRLSGQLNGVQEYMRRYPYTCLEQRASRAVALHDTAALESLANALPAYLDGDGMAKYFPSMNRGSDTLTAYLLAIADEAGWKLPADAQASMLAGLREFAVGRVHRRSEVSGNDLAIRRIAALEAVSRYEAVDETLAQSFTVQPNLWPTSAVLDWYGLLKRSLGWSQRDRWLAEAVQVIRTRLDLRGTTMGFSTERSDYLWWLMVSGDSNANRAILTMLDNPAWQDDLPRLARGSLGRQHQGHWNTTVANAWGVLALDKFSQRFESVAVGGKTEAALPPVQGVALDWVQQPAGGALQLGWPASARTLHVGHKGSGAPWLTVQSRAAVALAHPLAIGLKIVRTVTPLVQKTAGQWSRGDVMKVHLDLEAQSDAGWVVVDDPIPAGAVVLGNGLARDSRVLAEQARPAAGLAPAFIERTFEGYRAYYSFVPKGSWSVEYTVRLNNAGTFELPVSRVEAMYAPEVYGETPNAALVVGQ
ncbi:MAG: MG2 domain-containing protein, partial [Gallionella sp.]|nr:MG2 domain-containing protein [Gallionella sp.]